MPQDSGIVIKRYGYVLSEKGMGRAGQWKPKKEEDKRFFGKPGKHKVTFNDKGEKFVTIIGKNGRAIKEIHFTDHSNPKHHTNPHEHDIGWREDGSPDPGAGYPITKYSDIKGEVITMKSNMNQAIPEENFEARRFKTIEEFLDVVGRNGEIIFEYDNQEYGVTGGGSLNYIVYRSYEEESVIEYETPEETLTYPIGDKKLGDIITRAKIWVRTL